jgi:hypothetical protein
MLHSVKQIAENHSKYSELRKDEILFSKDHFFQYAKDHFKKYQLEWHLGDLLVSTFFSDDLVAGYKQTLTHPLKVGDKICVSGFVMLKGLDAGNWKVSRITDDGYFFTKLRGKKEKGFYFRQIDSWLESKSDINFIKKI